jgi:aryl-alcohol dehydrogenase-like predicted oxidoreductase
LKIERVDILQWLYRSEPIEDESRIKGLQDLSAEIDHTFTRLIDEGLVGSVGTFPYSVSFGEAASKNLKSVTGWITYFNLLERENLINLPDHAWLIGIRPLAAGKIFDSFHKLSDKELNMLAAADALTRKEKVMQLCLAYCLMQQQVKTNILSVNALEQAKSLQLVLKDILPVDAERLALAQKALSDN